ncbi:MAG: DUF973 family protein [Thermoplasmata archaeon]|nr:DUF973 family protein [Thermoplasmata archaeon]
MAAPEESLEEHRLFVQPEAPVSEDEEPTVVGAPTVEAPPVEVEISGLRRIQAGAIAGIVGIALGALTPIYLLFIVGAGLNASTATGGASAVAFTSIEVLFVALFAGVASVLVSFGLYIAGFARLRRADPRFGAPLGLAIVGLIGLLVLVGLVGLLFGILLQSLSCGGPGVAKASCVTLAASVPDPITLVSELFLGLVLGLVGWIGLVLGLYRVGRRYGSTLTRIGAILYIVPLADVAAPLLILIGTSGIVRRLRANPPVPPTLPESPPAPEEAGTVTDEAPTP